MKDRGKLEAKALELGIPLEDLNDPWCVKYLRTKLRKPKPYRDTEPRDASGYTDDFSCLVIRTR